MDSLLISRSNLTVILFTKLYYDIDKAALMIRIYYLLAHCLLSLSLPLSCIRLIF